MKKFFVLALVLVMTMTAVLAIPVSASYVWETPLNKPCGCSASFSAHYAGGIYSSNPDMANATADVTHICDGTYAYVSIKCWIAPYSNLSRYTYRNHSNSNSGGGSAHVTLEVDYSHDGTYALLAVENYYKVSVKHNGVEYVSQAFSSDGDAPASYTPPVVTE